jgi:hypothetical protein
MPAWPGWFLTITYFFSVRSLNVMSIAVVGCHWGTVIRTSARIGIPRLVIFPYYFQKIKKGYFPCMNHRQSTCHSAFDILVELLHWCPNHSTMMQWSMWTLYPLWSDTWHLFDTWPEFDTVSPGTEYHFARNSLVFSSGLKAQSSPFFPYCERKARYSTPVLLVTNKYCSCWIGVVNHPRDWHGYQLPINHQHTSYIKLSVHCAFEEGFVGLRFVFDAQLDRKSTKMKTISTQVFDELTVCNLSGFARKSTVKKYLAPRDSTSNSRRPLTRGVQSSHWPLHNGL